MANFVKSSVPYTTGNYIPNTNNPINIDLCTELIRSKIGNGYGVDFFCIEFKGCNAIWYYETAMSREADFNWIIDHALL